MEKRFLLFIFLSLVILTVYQSLVVKPVPKPAAGTTAAAGATAARGVAPSASVSPAPAEPIVPAVAQPAAPAPEVAALVGETSERNITVETREVFAVFTNRGARLKSWRLKHYFDQEHHPQELIEMALPNEPLPFTVRTESSAANAAINNALFAVSGEPSGMVDARPLDLTFEFRTSAGLHAIKSFHFEPSSYVVKVNISATEGDKALTPAIVWGPAVGDVGEVSRYTQAAEGLLFSGDKIERLAPKQLATQPSHQGDFSLAGVDDNYFMAAAIRLQNSTVEYRVVSVPPPAGSKDPARDLVSFTIQPHQASPIEFFAGPKDFDVLHAVAPEMTNAINFGRFQVIVVPLLRSLKGVHEWVPNYGWSIVVLTMIINLIMFPLRHMSAKSMRKMAEIQPEVKAIQDRYAKYKATDPQKQKMNQEMMALYKERGVNPAGGCVPILLTMPVLLAMWALLQTSIELRGAPWFGWIHDLSARDPYYALPVMMGATSLWQQRMMPATGADPAQQKMMMFMPVFMTVMLAWLPSGALIYYIVTNLWTIGQQYLTNFIIGPPPVRGPSRPAAERRVKRAGGEPKLTTANDR